MNGFNEGLLGTAAGIPIYASAIIITLGVLLCALLTLALHVSRGRGIAPVLSLSVFGFAFGVLFSRLLHWYFNAETYASFLTAMTDYSVGSFCLPGALLGIWLGAWLTKKLGLARSVGELLDDAAPGTALLIAVIRLSALFNTTCRSRIPVTTTSLQFVPLAMPEADLAGNTRWRLSTFFIELVLMLIVMGVVLYFRQERGARRMKKGSPRTGNVARLFMLLYAAVEIVLDSTRNDRPLMHFRLLSDLNQYSAFISLAQVFPAVMALGILIRYSVASVRANGLKWYHYACWAGFAASLFGIGKLGEYNVQRYAAYAQCYSIMAVSCALMVAVVWTLYRSCIAQGKPARARKAAGTGTPARRPAAQPRLDPNRRKQATVQP